MPKSDENYIHRNMYRGSSDRHPWTSFVLGILSMCVFGYYAFHTYENTVFLEKEGMPIELYWFFYYPYSWFGPQGILYVWGLFVLYMLGHGYMEYKNRTS